MKRLLVRTSVSSAIEQLLDTMKATTYWLLVRTSVSGCTGSEEFRPREQGAKRM
jgi:hypothetical protein